MKAEVLALVLLAALLSGCATARREPPAEGNAADLNLQLGIGYMQQGHYDVALEKLQKSLGYDDRSPVAHNAIGVLYEEIGRPALAETHFRKATTLDAGFGPAQLNYARFLCAHGQPAAGESQYLALLKTPELASADEIYLGAGACARRIPDPQRAEAHFRQALEVNPNAASALYELAELYFSQGNALQARASLQRFHALAGYRRQSLELGIAIEDALGGGDLRRHYVDLMSRLADSGAARPLPASP